MKYVDGVPLDEYKRKYIEKHGKMPFADTVQMLWGIAKGLDYAHEKKVIHRDIKPQNIMVGKTDGVQIIDFGLAAEIRTSLVKFSEVQMDVAGTRPYMAPEQWQGKFQDARTDQYALAVTAYEMFAGHVPFIGSDVSILRECVLHDEPEPIKGIPEHVTAALLKAMAKKREERFENCKTFIKAMAAKPKPVKEAAGNEEEVALSVAPEKSGTVSLPSDKSTGKTQPPVWVPQTMMSSVPPKKKALPFWLLPTVSATVILVLGLLGSFLMKPAAKPAKTPPVAAKKTAQPESRETQFPAREEKRDANQSGVAEATCKAGDLLELTLKDVKYRFRWCPAGTFMMGSPEDETIRSSRETQHKVTLTNGFWMG
jgi:serine/threonine protein kinase